MATAFPYRLYGGATRGDAISGLDRRFSEALVGLFNAAPPEVQRELGLNSAYRNRAIQQQLWDKSDKTGHSVARPGRSRHQHGTAADLYGFGLGGSAKVSPATRQWVTANAAKHGLYFPMGHEPWHIQLVDRHGGPVSQDPGSIDYDVGDSPLAATLGAFTTPEPETPLQKMSGMASAVAKSLLNKGESGVVPLGGDPGGNLPAVPLETPSAVSPVAALGTPGTPGDNLVSPTGGLAELFRVKAIGTPPVRPGMRF